MHPDLPLFGRTPQTCALTLSLARFLTRAVGGLDQHLGTSRPATIVSAADTLASLEGHILDINTIRRARAAQRRATAPTAIWGLGRAWVRAPAAESRLPSARPKGVDRRSALGGKMFDSTVVDVGSMSGEDFIAQAQETMWQILNGPPLRIRLARSGRASLRLPD